MDRRLLRLACESDVNYELLLPSGTEALLLVEKEGRLAGRSPRGTGADRALDSAPASPGV